MIIYRDLHPMLFRYDEPNISRLILGGSVRVSTFQACREAENNQARDCEDGKKTITSLPGANCPTTEEFARLLGVDPSGIRIEGRGVELIGENAVDRNEHVEAFVFCTSVLGCAAHMKAKFGDGCIRIKDPRAFFDVIDKHLRRALAPHKIGPCIVDSVEYTPRKNNYRDHTNKHAAFIKEPGAPKHFDNEAEVRAAWIPEGFLPKAETILIPEIADLLELI